MARARAIATRWRCPPDSSEGRRCSADTGSATTSSSSAARCARDRRLAHAEGAQRVDHQLLDRQPGIQGGVRVLLHELHAPAEFAQAPAPHAMSHPRRPAGPRRNVGSVSRSASRAVVVFPDPDSPTRASVVACGMANETPSTARCAAPADPRGSANSFTRSRTSSTGGPWRGIRFTTPARRIATSRRAPVCAPLPAARRDPHRAPRWSGGMPHPGAR